MIAMKLGKKLKSIHPIQKVLMSFIALILFGSILLWCPFSSQGAIRYIDALFTATSAVCVTGLTVLDTPHDFTLAGQIIILALIQLGGLGIMTLSIALVALLGGSFSIKWRFTMESIYSGNISFPVKSILKRIVLYTFSIELAAASILFTQFTADYDLPMALWHSLFHSISSFCNAGFSTFSESLTAYRSNPVVIFSSSAAIILGGLGFVVLTELLNARYLSQRRIFRRFSLHTRIVIATTLILVICGTMAIMALEWSHLFRNFTLEEKFLAGFFQSVTCRTAGFNTVNICSLREPTLFVMMFLMFIGGSPGSIAGGVKTSTIAVITGLVMAHFSGRRQVVFAGRAISADTVDRSVMLVLLAAGFICVAAFTLMIINTGYLHRPLLDSMFEVVSAFGTVGLSTGITPHLNDAGKALLIIVMYVGRLGPLTLIAGLTVAKKESPISYAEEQILIG